MWFADKKTQLQAVQNKTDLVWKDFKFHKK